MLVVSARKTTGLEVRFHQFELIGDQKHLCSVEHFEFAKLLCVLSNLCNDVRIELLQVCLEAPDLHSFSRVQLVPIDIPSRFGNHFVAAQFDALDLMDSVVSQTFGTSISLNFTSSDSNIYGTFKTLGMPDDSTASFELIMFGVEDEKVIETFENCVTPEIEIISDLMTNRDVQIAFDEGYATDGLKKLILQRLNK